MLQTGGGRRDMPLLVGFLFLSVFYSPVAAAASSLLFCQHLQIQCHHTSSETPACNSDLTAEVGCQSHGPSSELSLQQQLRSAPPQRSKVQLCRDPHPSCNDSNLFLLTSLRPHPGEQLRPEGGPSRYVLHFQQFFSTQYFFILNLVWSPKKAPPSMFQPAQG